MQKVKNFRVHNIGMDRIENLTQSYTQAPWRKQLRIIGLFFVGLVLIALVAGIYLTVSARAAVVGRDIQRLQEDLEEVEMQIEDLKSGLAVVGSISMLKERATAQGFVPVTVEQIVYLSIPGYAARQPVILATSSERHVVSAQVMPAKYTESLIEWLKRVVINTYFSISGILP